MVKRFVLFIVFCTISILYANDSFSKKMNYFSNYNEAVKYSISKYKPIMLIIVSTSCPWCKKLENQVLNKKQINDFIQLSFTPILLNREKDAYPKDRFKAKVVPTAFFIDPLKQEIIHKVYGYKSKKKFFKELQTARKLYYKGN